MKLDWDYTDLARSYLKRPEYCTSALEQMFLLTGTQPGMLACDVGAGTGNLTVPLLERGLRVVAVEPNAAMRTLGIGRTAHHKEINWISGRGEEMGLAFSAFDLVTFGSSFGVVERAAALAEAARILKDGGWFVCLWNHRDLDDPVQQSIERLIQQEVPDYQYGIRRQDQSEVIQANPAFGQAAKVEASFEKVVDTEEWLEAWRSHATLKRQAGSKFEALLAAIAELVRKAGNGKLTVPYTTRAWLAQKLTRKDESSR